MTGKPIVRVAFLNVGQGDTIVITVPESGEAVIVDCINANGVIQYLEQEGIRKVRAVLITHLHLDHYRGVVDLLENIEERPSLEYDRLFFYRPKLTQALRAQLYRDDDGHSDTTQRQLRSTNLKLLRWAQENARKRYIPLARHPEFYLPLEGVIEMIHPWDVDLTTLEASGLNNTSCVLKVHGSHSSALLTGDLEPVGWEWLRASLEDEQLLQSDVLKFPHHGAWRKAEPDTFLDSVDPRIVVISVGTRGHQYSHPNLHVFNSIAARSILLMCTEATVSCSETLEQEQLSMVAKHRAHSQINEMLFLDGGGCPCAGTIVIELGKIARVVYPEVQFHQNEIVKSHLAQHRCRLTVDDEVATE